MGQNASLNKAKRAKEDEFYTQREDIERELSHYKDFFNGKVVYCNCDDPVDSEFWKFFVRVFKDWNLKKLMATHYEPDAKNYAFKLEVCDGSEPVITPIQSNGDFRSQVCIDMLEEADIVVTNPPFSLFREYVGQLMEHKKKFLIIGSQNAIKYKEIFPRLMHNQMWLGYYAGDMKFKVPDYYEPRETRYWQDETGQKWRSLGNACWFTNLDIAKRHQMLDLRGNYYKAEDYPSYLNFDAIDVSRVENIPCDYDGKMGVPITFMQFYNPDQFEIIGIGESSLGVEIGFSANLTEEECAALLKENKSFRRGNPVYRDENGRLHKPFSRIIIRNKNPEVPRWK